MRPLEVRDAHWRSTATRAAQILWCIVLVVALGSPAVAKPVQIWVTPRQSSVDFGLPPGQRVQFDKYDFSSFLEPNAPWQTAMRRVAVVRIGMHTFERYADLPAVVALTNRTGARVATAGAVMFTGGTCLARPMEGMDSGSGYAHEIVAAILKWKAAGGRLDIVVMDSPLAFGFFVAAAQCHFSLAEVAQRTAATLARIRAIYPHVEFMDAESPGRTPLPDWLMIVHQWVGLLKSYAAPGITYFGMDLHWTEVWDPTYSWVAAARDISRQVRGLGIHPGLFINADDKGVDNTGWAEAARDHIRLAADSNLDLDFIDITSWKRFPERNLPEQDPTSLTSLINFAYDCFGGRQ